MNLYEKTWPQVEEYLKTKQSVIIPTGSTEQHGPTGIIGIDFLSAWHIAQAVGKKTQTLVSSPVCFGMALHHMNFPGTISLSPATYIQVIAEIVQSLAHHGFKYFHIINGHGGNIAPITSAMSQVLSQDESYQFNLINWWHLPAIKKYEENAFGNESGWHATCAEISVTMYTQPEAYHSIQMKQDYKKTPSQYPWPMSPKKFKETFPDGRMGSNPSLCSAQHGQEIFNIAVDTISKDIGQLGC